MERERERKDRKDDVKVVTRAKVDSGRHERARMRKRRHAKLLVTHGRLQNLLLLRQESCNTLEEPRTVDFRLLCE